jgi:hypothetical protein
MGDLMVYAEFCMEGLMFETNKSGADFFAYLLFPYL